MKIEAKSLMIGNVVEYNRNNVWERCTVTLDDMLDAQVHPHKYRPIPLTPSILEAAGFVKENMIATTTYVTYTHEEVEGWFDLYFEAHTVRFGIADHEVANCEYLHQLQNLMYALLQTELTITLP